MNTRETDRTDEDGFTLIEVLVSLAILTLSLTVLLGIFGQSLSRIQDSEKAAAARVLAQSILMQTETTQEPRMGHSDGENDGGYRWSLDVTPYPQRDDDRATLHAATITVTVSWDDGAKSLTLTSLRLVPKPGAP